MPGSAIADVLHRRPLELALRAALAFGLAVWLCTRLGPPLLDALLPWYEQAVHRLDDRYRIDFALSHRTGHDKIGADLVVLGRATAMKTLVVFAADKPVMLWPGSVLTCSTTTGLLLQPATMMLGLFLGWPVCRVKVALIRSVLGAMLLALWILLGIPLALWIGFLDLPVRAYVPDAFSFSTAAGRFLLNGGGVVAGALLAAGAIAAAARYADLDHAVAEVSGRDVGADKKNCRSRDSGG